MEFDDGTRREYRGGFPMYGSDYNTALAESLGCALTDDGQVDVDDHGRTSIDDVYAVGDVTPGHNQVPVAMGQGAQGPPYVPPVDGGDRQRRPRRRLRGARHLAHVGGNRSRSRGARRWPA